MVEPRPPEDLRLVDPDGGVWPCAVAFSHTDEQGLNHWTATPIGLSREVAKQFGPGWKVKMGVLPAMTTVEWKRPE